MFLRIDVQWVGPGLDASHCYLKKGKRKKPT